MATETNPAARLDNLLTVDLIQRALTANLRSSYRSIFLHRSDSPEDRTLWHSASQDERLKASDEVHADTSGPNRYRLTWGLPA